MGRPSGSAVPGGRSAAGLPKDRLCRAKMIKPALPLADPTRHNPELGLTLHNRKRKIWERIHGRKGTSAPRGPRTPGWYDEPPGGGWARRGPSVREGPFLVIPEAVTCQQSDSSYCRVPVHSTGRMAVLRRPIGTEPPREGK